MGEDTPDFDPPKRFYKCETRDGKVVCDYRSAYWERDLALLEAKGFIHETEEAARAAAK